MYVCQTYFGVNVKKLHLAVLVPLKFDIIIIIHTYDGNCNNDFYDSVSTNDHTYCQPATEVPMTRCVQLTPTGTQTLTGTQTPTGTQTQTSTQHDKHFISGTALKLLNHEDQVIATGLAMEGNVLHGKSIPNTYLKVAINEVLDSSQPLKFVTAFDDKQNLSVGIITAWPRDRLMLS